MDLKAKKNSIVNTNKSGKTLRWSVTILILCYFASPVFSAGKKGSSNKMFGLVREGVASATVVLGSKATDLELHAAEELRKYVHKMTGAELPIVRETEPGAEKASSLILIGRSETHDMIKTLCKKSLINLSSDFPGGEGFILKTLSTPKRSMLVIGGSVDYSTLYGVYELLGRFGKVGFFRYEERVPKVKSFLIPQINVVERPFYQQRMIGNQIHYWGIHWWDEDDWKDEMDWCAKHRINAYGFIPIPIPAGALLENEFYRQLGLSVPKINSAQRIGLEVGRRTCKYAKMLGVDWRDSRSAWNGKIPKSMEKEFLAKYPNVKTIRSRRGHLFVHPADPFLGENILRRIELVEQLLGTRSNILNFPNYGEDTLGDTDTTEADEVSQAYGNTFATTIKRLEKTGKPRTWVLESWMMNNREYWTQARVKKMLSFFPKDLPIVIWDLLSESDPLYEYHEGWRGQKWAFMSCLNMAMMGFPVGNVNNLLTRAYEIRATTKFAENCVGFGVFPEMRDYSPLYFELAYKLAWNPVSVDLRSFLREYAVRRYGVENARQMMPALQAMVDTVYGPNMQTTMAGGFQDTAQICPKYFYHIGPQWSGWPQLDDKARMNAASREFFVPRLAWGLEQALTVSDSLRGEAAYERDLVDMGRSLLHALFNSEMIRMYDAFQAGDKKAFQTHARLMRQSLDWVYELVSCLEDRHEYSASELVKQYRQIPWGKSEKAVKNYLLYADFGRRVYEYHRADWAEVVSDFYKPRVEASLSVFQNLLEQGETQIKPHKKAFDAAQKGIADRFLNTPLVPPKSKYGSAVEAADAMLKWLKKTGVLDRKSESYIGTGKSSVKDEASWWNKDTKEGVYKEAE